VQVADERHRAKVAEEARLAAEAEAARLAKIAEQAAAIELGPKVDKTVPVYFRKKMKLGERIKRKVFAAQYARNAERLRIYRCVRDRQWLQRRAGCCRGKWRRRQWIWQQLPWCRKKESPQEVLDKI